MGLGAVSVARFLVLFMGASLLIGELGYRQSAFWCVGALSMAALSALLHVIAHCKWLVLRGGGGRGSSYWIRVATITTFIPFCPLLGGYAASR